MEKQNRIAAFSSLGPLFFLGIVAGTQICAVSLYLDCRYNFVVFLLSILLSIGVYLLNRVLETDNINYPERSIFFVRFKWLLAVSIAALVVPIAVLLATGNLRPLPVFFLGSLIGVLYSVKILPFYDGSNIRWISLKHIPLVKNISVSLLWGGSALAIVILMCDTRYFFRPDVIMLFFTFTILNLNSTIACDIRDIEGDRTDSITTLPTLLGLKKTFLALSALNIAGGVVVSGAFLTGAISLLLTVFCIFCILWSSAGIIPYFFVGRIKLPRAVHEVFIDSHLLVSSLGLIAISFLK
jgi:4-hydroxybenzoate polyprenyltransferase